MRAAARRFSTKESLDVFSVFNSIHNTKYLLSLSELSESCSFVTDKEEQIKDASVMDITGKKVSLELQVQS